MVREIVLDTETTGLYPNNGDRIVEIGCVELFNHLPTGRSFHTYINPQRDIPIEASRISGITNETVKDAPLFVHIVEDFLEFIGEDLLVIHNASFDIAFFNAELERLCRPQIPLERAVDTLKMARKKFPGSPASLDALCRRYNIDLSVRTKHGALVDSELLAQVYLELIGGRQVSFEFQASEDAAMTRLQVHSDLIVVKKDFRPSRNFQLTEQEKIAHEEFLKGIKDPIWRE